MSKLARNYARHSYDKLTTSLTNWPTPSWICPGVTTDPSLDTTSTDHKISSGDSHEMHQGGPSRTLPREAGSPLKVHPRMAPAS